MNYCHILDWPRTYQPKNENRERYGDAVNQCDLEWPNLSVYSTCHSDMSQFFRANDHTATSSKSLLDKSENSHDKDSAAQS